MITDDLFNVVCERIRIDKRFGLPCVLGVSLMFREGLRVAEVCALRVRDVFFEDGSPHIKVLGKGKKYRAVELSENTFNILLRIYPDSNYFSINPVDSKLIAMPDGTPVIKSRLQRALREKTNKFLSPHKLRHQYVTKQRGISDDILIGSAIGHSEFGNIMKYGEITPQMVDRGFYNPTPEKINTYPIPHVVKSGDFIPIEIIRNFINNIENQHTKMMVYLMAYCGLKTSELVTLQRRHYIRSRQRFEMGDRVIPIRFYDSQFINAYFSHYFPTDKIFKITHSMVLYRIRKEAKRQGVEINGKLLHASYIVWQLNRGVSPIILATMLGTKYSNVARYIPCASVARQIALKMCGELGRP